MFAMNNQDDNRCRLDILKMRLEQVKNAWSVNTYESLLKFHIDIIPKVMDAERCSIFMHEPGMDQIWLKFGTGLREKEIIPPKKNSIVGTAISLGRCIINNDIDLKSSYHSNIASRTKFITRNLICAPIKSLSGHGITGAIEVLNKKGEEKFSKKDKDVLMEVASYLSMAIENILINQEILQISNLLSCELDKMHQYDTGFIANSPVMRDIIDKVHVVSATPVNILICGESGTGKELIARMIHEKSTRGDKPFVAVNCASIPDTLMESEFFGYEKGAFTGAVTSKRGRFEEAHGGTLFLDEIGDMPLHIQPKFLRAIQEGEGSRLGSNKTYHYDFRIISATNKDLHKQVIGGFFREDLFYRIFSVEILIPPLRERREDIVPLALSFLDRVSKSFTKSVSGFSSETLNLLEQYPWPGNIRQLLHEIERMVALTPEEETISLKRCSQALIDWMKTHSTYELRKQPVPFLPDKIKELEISFIQDALLKTKGNKLQASKILGITRQGLDKKIKRFNIRPLSS
jgi:transcriptional regulator with GAF, ATPase, and Fis domain